MKFRNVTLTLVLAAGAGALAARGLVKNKDLADKAKEEGTKIVDDAKKLGGIVKEAVNEAVQEIKDKANKFIESVEDIDIEDELKTADEIDEEILTPEARAEVEKELTEDNKEEAVAECEEAAENLENSLNEEGEA